MKRVWFAFAIGLGLAGSVPAQDRVAAARTRVDTEVKRLARAANLPYPIPRLFFRAFKEERTLEIWGSNGRDPYRRVVAYRVAGQSGVLGPKRKEGDKQVPEGFYTVDRLNPRSRFLLSIGINYPNASDRLRSDRARPGGDIFIHGDDVSIGCLAMTDPVIEVIYVMTHDTWHAGGRRIPVHIFPNRMTDANWARLQRDYRSRPDLIAFWRELRPGFLAFESTRRVPTVSVGRGGAYRVRGAASG